MKALFNLLALVSLLISVGSSTVLILSLVFDQWKFGTLAARGLVGFPVALILSSIADSFDRRRLEAKHVGEERTFD